MTGLLDTHSLLWAIVAPEKLSPKVRGVIADTANDIYVSTVSFWEISLKFSIGKLDRIGCSPEDLVAAAGQMGVVIASPTAEEFAWFS
jgi:PIN domain nuclease of toxin-antitoxin system